MTQMLTLLLDERRRWLLQKLERVMSRIEKGGLPMSIVEVYLFGSFLKEKGYPRDIDILLIYDSTKTAEMYEYFDRQGKKRWGMWGLGMSPSRLRGMLKSNAETTVDINICPSLEAFQVDLEYEMDTWLSIWKPQDRDWRGKLVGHFRRQRE
jgi:hypothetical protein